MVRFESAELTKRLKREGAPDDYEDEEIVETEYENNGDNVIVYEGDDNENADGNNDEGDKTVIFITNGDPEGEGVS